jgi:hypothetical protein
MGAESSKSSIAPTGAVFLSYASQDVEAAEKICDASRAVGVEVWFDNWGRCLGREHPGRQ